MDIRVKVKSGGRWEEIEKIFIKDGGKWREVESIYIKNREDWSTKLVPKDVPYEVVEEYWDRCSRRVRRRFWRYKTVVKYKTWYVNYYDGGSLKSIRRLSIANGKKVTSVKIIKEKDGTKTVREAYYKWVDEYYSCKKNRKVYKTRRIWV